MSAPRPVNSQSGYVSQILTPGRASQLNSGPERQSQKSFPVRASQLSRSDIQESPIIGGGRSNKERNNQNGVKQHQSRNALRGRKIYMSNTTSSSIHSIESEMNTKVTDNLNNLRNSQQPSCSKEANTSSLSMLLDDDSEDDDSPIRISDLVATKQTKRKKNIQKMAKAKKICVSESTTANLKACKDNGGDDIELYLSQVNQQSQQQQPKPKLSGKTLSKLSKFAFVKPDKKTNKKESKDIEKNVVTKTKLHIEKGIRSPLFDIELSDEDFELDL